MCRLRDVAQLLSTVPPIYNTLEKVRDENINHSQYVTAMENLKHIFTVQSSVTKTMQWIEQDKLLPAHHCLTDLENSRDDLLFELHKLPRQSAHDKITLKRYFEKVEVVSQQLERKIRLIMSRTLATVRNEPTVIVTALRIIEREEKADHFALQQQKQTGFLPPGRPKEWRRKTIEVLQAAVVDRIEGSKLEERSDNKLWLVRDLELARQFILGDLRVVRSLCTPCFPPHYDIFNEYVRMYHEALSKYVSIFGKLCCNREMFFYTKKKKNVYNNNLYVSVSSWKRSSKVASRRTSTFRCYRGLQRHIRVRS